jgi:coatomer protein complex subunit alpha (xenin)
MMLQLLNRQAGVVDFSPLKPIFIDIYRSSKLYLPANASLPPLQVSLRRTKDESSGLNVLPLAARSLQSVTSELNNAYALFRRANFVEAANTFRSVLQSLLLVLAQTPEEESEVSHFARSHRV